MQYTGSIVGYEELENGEVQSIHGLYTDEKCSVIVNDGSLVVLSENFKLEATQYKIEFPTVHDIIIETWSTRLRVNVDTIIDEYEMTFDETKEIMEIMKGMKDGTLKMFSEDDVKHIINLYE